MINKHITKLMFFETKYGLPSLNFNGYRISYDESNDKFMLMTKEATSRGAYVGECEIEDVTNKRVKMAWRVIEESQSIFKNHEHMGVDYAMHIVLLLVRMYHNNRVNINDDSRFTFNQYNIAQKTWLKIKEELK